MALTVVRNPVRGVELGYAEITANITRTSSTPTEVPGLSVTVTVGSRPIIVRFAWAVVSHSVAQGTCSGFLYEGATLLGAATSASSTAGANVPLLFQRRLAPSAGSHTYTVQAGASAATGTFTASGDGGFGPAFLQVLEC